MIDYTANESYITQIGYAWNTDKYFDEIEFYKTNKNIKISNLENIYKNMNAKKFHSKQI